MKKKLDDSLLRGIDEKSSAVEGEWTPYNVEGFKRMRVTDVWKKYADVLSWGKGQCLAVLDDGCDTSVPEWQTEFPWGKKVVAEYSVYDGSPCAKSKVLETSHGTTVAWPSSQCQGGIRGVAYNNFVAHVICCSNVIPDGDESADIAAALRWVLDNHEKHNITTVSFSPVDGESHAQPIDSVLDGPLAELRNLGIWVSSPCGNFGFTDGIAWPASQPHSFAIGATKPDEYSVHLSRYSNTDLLVVASATSSSNAYVAGSAMIMREAIEKSGYDWAEDGANLPEAMMALFKQTGMSAYDPDTDITYKELDLLAAIDHVFAG